jgi:hypothetical protein
MALIAALATLLTSTIAQVAGIIVILLQQRTNAAKIDSVAGSVNGHSERMDAMLKQAAETISAKPPTGGSV